MSIFDNTAKTRYYRFMTLDVSLTPHLEQFIHETVSSGRYQSASDVVRTALRLLEEREQERSAKLQWLLEAIQTGLDSGPSVPMTDDFWQDLRNQLRQRDQASPRV